MAKNNKKTKVAIIIFLITAIIATALTAVLAFGDSNEGYRTITVIEIQGTVGVVHDNIEYSAYTGMHLEEGYTVVTGGNSYIRLLLDDDKYVKLESGTKAIFSEVSGGKTSINIERGALVAEVTKPLQVDEDFIVNTPNAVLAVRGTLFRVDLSRNDKGELNTDVMTYGGAVSSKRIQPTGEVEDIEVTIKEGFKATVNMDDKETVYLVDEVKVDLSALVGKPSNENKPNDTITETNLNGEIIENAPITIPDDDLVDIYFASENGHSMFIETKEIEEKIVERNIDVAEKTPVYEVAQRVVEPVEIVIPDDNKSLVTTTEPVTEVVAVQGPPNDGVGDETTTELTTVPSTTAPTTTVPSTTAPTTTVPSTTVPTTTVPSTTVSTTTVPTTESTTVTTTEQTTEPTTEETTVHTHTEVTEEVKATCTKNGLKTVKCSDCGEIISETVLTATGHSEEKTTIEPTCTEAGKETVTCTVCDELISETILNATGHREIFSGAKDAHTECEICYEILSADHTYKTSTTNASCTLDGGTTYVCECGYNYTETIPATGHTEKTATVDATCTVDGKTTVSCSVCTETLSETVIPATGHTEENGAGADIHTKCSVCGSTVKDGSYHDYTDEVTTQNTCTSEGVLTHTCTCGWSYTEAIPASHKKSDDGLTCVNGCGGVWVDLNSTNFPDSMFLSYISSTYDADGNNALIGDEVTGVTTINVAGDSTADGGYIDLTGIKNFTNLVNVNCAYNSGITSLDLSGLTLLTELDVTGLTGLETLNISGCTNLTDEKITGLDTCTALIELNVSGCTNIAELNLNSNIKVETVNLSNCSALTSFVINDNTIADYALNSINLSGCTSLETLTINNCLSLTTIDFTDLTAIKTIDLGGCQNVSGALNLSGKTALTTITIGGTKVTSLNVSGSSSVTDVNALACSQLSSVIGINDCTSLTTLMLKGTAITSLDLNSQNPSLQSLSVENCTSLTYLDLMRSSESTTFNSLAVTGCTALKTLNLYNCKGITTLDTTILTALEELNLTYSGVATVNSSTSTMDFSQNLNLKRVYLNGVNSFTEFDVSSNTLLEEFALSDNSNVTTLDFSSNTKLKNLNLSDVSALDTLDISACTSLESVSLLNTGLTTLSVTGSDALTQFWVYNNMSLVSLTLTGGANLTSVKLSSGSENPTLKTLSITNCGITSLDVTYLTKLTTLDVSNCSALANITGLDNLTLLESFNATGSGIESIDASTLTNLSTLAVDDMSALESLNISNTAVASLSLDGCSSLKHFYVNNNANFADFTNIGLTSLTTLVTVEASNSDVSDSDTQSILQALENSETSEPQSLDLSKNTAITSLDIRNCTLLGSLNASGCTGLATFTENENTALTDLNLSGCTSITELDVGTCTSLENLNASGTAVEWIELCYSENITTVNVSNCTSMTVLVITSETNNKLTSLDVSGCTAMTDLQIDNSTALEDLNLSGLTSLTSIYLYGTTGLKTVDVSNTNVGSLDLSGCSNITSVIVTGSRISSGGVTLPAGKDESIITGLGT